MSIKLRNFKRSDLKYFLKWWKDRELVNLTSGFFEKSDKILTEYFLDIFNHPKDHHYIIQYGDKAIGHVALSHKTKETFEVQIVIGEKEYWGKGFGSEAINKVMKIAFNKLGYIKAYLDVRPENIRAIKAYESCGFVKKGLKKYPKNKYQPVTLKMVLNSCMS